MEAGMSVRVHYVEGHGQEARAGLARLLATLGGRPGFLSADLLGSPAQADLCLLESRWSGEPPALELPPGCKGWTFVVERSL